MGLFNVFTKEIAIDLGTANTLIIHNNKIVVDQPSIVAVERNTGKIIAVGDRAKHMQGKTHEEIKTIRPLKDGVIADFQASESMIKEFIKQIPGIKGRVFQPARTIQCRMDQRWIDRAQSVLYQEFKETSRSRWL